MKFLGSVCSVRSKKCCEFIVSLDIRLAGKNMVKLACRASILMGFLWIRLAVWS